jgi:uncharacterized protein YacL (UPF0231 family)
MLEAKIKNALIALLDNPIQKTKKLLPDFEDRRKLYSLPAFEYIVMARREAEKAADRVRKQLKKDVSIRSLSKEKKRIEEEIKSILPEEKIPVKAEHIINADKKQGCKSFSYYDAEAQALGKDEKYVCLMHNLLLIKDSIFELCRQAISGAMETVPADYRHSIAGFLRKSFGYAPAKKVKEIPKKEEKRRYREIDIFADDRKVLPWTEKLMQPGRQSQAEASGWLKLSQAGYINPSTRKLECSFA